MSWASFFYSSSSLPPFVTSLLVCVSWSTACYNDNQKVIIMTLWHYDIIWEGEAESGLAACVCLCLDFLFRQGVWYGPLLVMRKYVTSCYGCVWHMTCYDIMLWVCVTYDMLWMFVTYDELCDMWHIYYRCYVAYDLLCDIWHMYHRYHVTYDLLCDIWHVVVILHKIWQSLR